MKKLLALTLALMMALTLAACGGSNSGGVTPDTGAFNSGGADSGNATTTPTATTTPANNGGSASGTTLDALKQKAADLGYEVADLQDYQKMGLTNVVDGFNVTISDGDHPVYEFKTAQDAENAAKRENEAGYNTPFVNGKFYAIAGKNNADALAAIEAVMGVAPSALK